MKIKSTSVILALGILLMAGALGLVGYRILSDHNAVSLSGEIVSEMQEMIPQYKADDPRATGMGRDPLPMIEIEGVSLVGYLEFSSPDTKIPVADYEYDGHTLSFAESGSPVKGKFVIGGSETEGGFDCLKDVKPGSDVTFVDVNGVRYSYRITGAGSVRKLDDLDHDLVMYCGISDETFLAVYASKAD
jgi:hypothetical protein